MVAKYKCECGYKWKSKNSSGGTKSCNMCYKDVQPYKYRPAKEKVLYYTIILVAVILFEFCVVGVDYAISSLVYTGVEEGIQADVWRVLLRRL